MIRVQFAAGIARWKPYKHKLSRAIARAGVAAEVSRKHPPRTVDYIVYAPNAEFESFTPYTQTKAVLCLWAGVEDILADPTLTQPLCRMVDSGLTEGMVEWVTGHVLRHHLGMDAHIVNPQHHWHPAAPPLARARCVGVLGLGELGRASAVALSRLHFNVIGWSRSEKRIPGIRTRHGPEGLDEVLRSADILVLLLPQTPQTENLLDDARLARMRQGAVIINPGRGPLIDDDALLRALDTGLIGHATLDVFRQEPLPRDHPFWAHPRVTVTPHIASETRVDTAVDVIAENIRRGEAGAPFLHLVDRGAGY